LQSWAQTKAKGFLKNVEMLCMSVGKVNNFEIYFYCIKELTSKSVISVYNKMDPFRHVIILWVNIYYNVCTFYNSALPRMEVNLMVFVGLVQMVNI
jgi:hypothetical protein